MHNLDILFEDNHVIVCYKEKGILSQADGSNAPDMLTIIKEYLVKKYNKPGDAYLGLVHRLDRNTSGVMVFAKTSKGARRLAEDMQNGGFKKTYLAVCEGTFNSFDEVKLVDKLEKNEKLNKSFISPNGKESILIYRPIKEHNGKTLVEIELLTGRHHQIRVQMSNIGHPLYGDKKYGSKYDGELALQAYKLSFHEPVTNELLTFSRIDYSGIFNIFK